MEIATLHTQQRSLFLATCPMSCMSLSIGFTGRDVVSVNSPTGHSSIRSKTSRGLSWVQCFVMSVVWALCFIIDLVKPCSNSEALTTWNAILSHIKLMQAQRSIFRTVYLSSSYKSARGVRTSNPLLYKTSSSIHLPQAQVRTYTMASATSFYDFKPLDSKSSLSRARARSCISADCSQCRKLQETIIKSSIYPSIAQELTTYPHRRKRPTRPPRRLQEQSNPHCQHRLQMRFHTSIRRSRSALQKGQSHPPRRLHHSRLPLQPIRRPRAGIRRRYSEFLPNQLRCFFPYHGQDGCEWRRCKSAF